ncbi:MAG: PASTA domain-containing protein [Chlorobiaceae bacterium]|jgi:eukaryotic-like serine/threonine-protein kinase|nr:PASTA domain-containing protein [Chlorobiaceae bacterium]
MKKAGLIVLLLIGFVVIFDKIIMPFYISQGSVKVVPSVINLDYNEAERRLGWAGFEAVKSYHVKYLSNVDSNIVLSQMPEAGTEVKPGRKVYLVVNKREKPSFAMPDLLGRPEFDARQSAARMEIVIQDVQVSSVTNPEEDGRVLNQSIPAQAIVKSGTPVSIIIGKYEASPEGTNKIVIPDVLGMSLSRAEQVVANAGLKLGTVKTEYSALLVPNTVISQKPAVGSFVSPDQPVELTVVTMGE